MGYRSTVGACADEGVGRCGKLRMCCAVQTSHFTPTQAGQIFNRTRPRLAVIHHATVNDASREALSQT